MSTFQAVDQTELCQVEGGSPLLVGAFVAVVVGVTLVGGYIAYKSAENLVDSQQQSGSSCGSSSK